jgi:hypothetical protein
VDFAGGPQVLVGAGRFFGSITSGPATMGLVHGLGWRGVVTVGASTF